MLNILLRQVFGQIVRRAQELYPLSGFKLIRQIRVGCHPYLTYRHILRQPIEILLHIDDQIVMHERQEDIFGAQIFNCSPDSRFRHISAQVNHPLAGKAN